MRTNGNFPINAQEAFSKASHFCSTGERCRSQVKKKLIQWNVPSEMIDGILTGLENAGFLSEDRYAELFVRSKVRQNNWGRYKILQALQVEYVNNESIQYGFSMLDEQAYIEALQNVLRKARLTIHDNNKTLFRKKIIQHAISKGFEIDLITSLLNNYCDGEMI